MVLSADSTDSPIVLYDEPQIGVRHREFGIDFDSAPEEGYSRATPGGYVHLHRRAVRLQGFERRRRRLGERRRVLFHGGQRFAHPGSEFARDLTESVQDVFSPRRLRLLLIQNVSRVAVPRAQAQYVLASQACDRAFQNRGARGSLADLAARSPESAAHLSAVPSDASVCWTCRSEIRLRNGDCSQLYGQSLAQRVVKYRIAGLILEIGQDNGVLVGESRGTVKIEVCRGEQRQNSRGGRNRVSRGLLAR